MSSSKGRLEQFPDAVAVVGVIHPERLRVEEDVQASLEAETGLRWRIHGSRGGATPDSPERSGSVEDLADQLRALPLEMEGADLVAAAAEIVRYAVEKAVAPIRQRQRISERIAGIIAETDKESDRLAALQIGCLVLFNALAFQDRLADVNPAVLTVRESWREGLPGIRRDWQAICDDEVKPHRRNTMKVGFIGLGTMGASMAYNCLQGGNEMVVHDIRREAATRHLEAGADWADSPREVAEASEIVFTSLPGPTEVEAVGLGEDGILEGMSEGKVYFDLSTSTPTLIRHIHEEAAARGIHVLDAPVSGGPRGAASRNLAIWVGGDQEVFDRCKPVLDSIGDKAYYVGPIGCGAIAKLVHNCTGYIVQAALAEVFTMGVKAGVEPLALWQAVRKGAQGRRGTFEGLAEHLLPGKFDPPDFALRLARKDVDLAVGVGREYDVPMRLAQLTLQEMTEALNRGWGHRDSRVAMLLQEERAGVEVRVDEALLQAVLEEERSAGA